MVAAISERRYWDFHLQRRLVSWQTRTISQVIAATVPVPKGKSNPLADHAARIDIDVGSDEVDGQVGTGNSPGSYEKAMLMLGRGFQKPE